MKLIGISGKRRSGKSTLGDVLKQQFGYVPLSLAAPLKSMVREHFGLTEDQTDGVFKEQPTQYERESGVAGFHPIVARYWTPRQIMIDMGRFYRSVDPQYWIRRLVKQVEATPQAQTKTYVITDIRFRNEADWLRKHNGFLVRLEREEVFTGVPIDDPSENELDNYDSFDLVIHEYRNRTMDDMDVTAMLIHDRILALKF